MPFLRVEKKASGSYLRILESFRDEQGKPTHRILHTLGKVEDYTPEQLRRMGIKLYELGGGEVIDLLNGATEELGRYNYGYQQIYGKVIEHYGLFDVFRRIQRTSRIQYNLYDAVLLMLLERLQYPCSKLKNHEHQHEYLNLPTVELHHLYRSLDILAKYNERIQQQIYQTGRDLFSSSLDVVFFDVTTFYFDSDVENEGELRQMGYGKDGKIGRTQILFCMLIDKDKNPVGYKIFKGNTYEGDTFKHAIQILKQSYQIDKVIIVADRGMLSKANLELTVNADYEYIVGERLKGLPQKVQEVLIDKSQYQQEWIYTDHDHKPVHISYTTLEYKDRTIICSYSQRRAKKDKYDREQRIEKAQKLIKKPSSLKNKAYRYFIKSTSDNTYQLDENKIKKHEKYDGLMAISTNTNMSTTQVLEQYKQLYKIEHSFRSFKSHLEVRPMFHWTDSRIRGHICLCYMAFALQTYVLNKVNKNKKHITENTLRATLNRMQVSLIQNKGKQLYLRSKPQEKEALIQTKMGLKPILPLIPKEKLIL